MIVVLWVLIAVVVLLSVLVVGLLRSHAQIVRALHDAGIDLDPDHAAPTHSPTGGRPLRETTEIVTDTAPVIRTVEGVPGPAEISGTRAADISGLTPIGASRAISMAGSQTTLLAFLTTGCATCAEFWNSFAAGARPPRSMRLVIVTKSGNEESPSDVAALAPPDVLTISSSEAWDDYRIPVAPYFVLVDGANGVVIGEGAARSWELVMQLLDRALADAGHGPQPVRRRDLFLGRDRAKRVDLDLTEAGLTPGDPRLYHDTVEETP